MFHINWLFKNIACIFETAILPFFLLLIFLFYFLASPLMPGDSLDEAWQFGMNEAVSKGLIFGKDLVFTFGPYASVITKSYHPGIENLILAAGFFLSFHFLFLHWITFRKKDLHTKLLLLFAIALLFSIINDGIIYSFLLLTGINLLEQLKQHSEWKNKHLFLSLLTFPIGLIVLIKGSFLLFALVLIGVAFLYAMWQKQWKSAAWIAMTPFVSVVLFWLIAGQPISALPFLFTALAPVISGYSEAMAGKEGKILEIATYIGISLYILWLLFKEEKLDIPIKSMYLMLYGAMLFICFKAGFVGGSTHKFYSVLPLIFTAFMLYAQFQRKLAFVPIFASVSLWLFVSTPVPNAEKINSALLILNPRYYIESMSSFIKRVTQPEKLKQAYQEKLSSYRELVNLPKLPGTSDIFPHHQTYLLASGNTWSPRPILQSYSAYTPILAQKNAHFLESTDSPDHIFFSIAPLRKRFPALDDGATWPILFANYQPAGYYHGFLHLKKRSPEKRLSPSPQLHSKITAKLGDTVTIPQIPGKLVYAKVIVEKTILGHLSKFLYALAPLDMQVILKHGHTKAFKFVPTMGKSIFLVAPLVERAEVFAALYGHSHLLESNKPEAFVIVPLGPIKSWKSTFSIEFYTSAPPPTPEEFPYLDYFQSIDQLGKISITRDCPCAGNLESAPKSTPKDTPLLQHNAFFNYPGWLAKSPRKGILADQVLVLLTDPRGAQLFVAPKRTVRKTIGTYFDQPKMVHAAFVVTADASLLQGTYTMELAYLENNTLCICSSNAKKIHFLPMRFED